MAIDRRYIPAFSLDNVFRDKDTGDPLANGTLEFFINNTSIQKDVYQIAGTSPNYTFTPLPNPMTLSLAGTLVDGAGNPVIPYFLPFNSAGEPEYYDVVCKSSGGVTQFTRESVPYIPDLLSPDDGASNYTNEISNPQFVEVLFDTSSASYTYNFSGASLEEVPLAPGWDLIVTGTGGVTVSRVAIEGTLNLATNPPYVLEIGSSGAITVLQLRQRLVGTPGIWANGRVSSYMLAKTNSSAVTLSMSYVDSNGTSQELASGTLPSSGAYTPVTGEVALPVSSNPQTSPDAYVDIVINIPTGVQIRLTSIQVVFTGNAIVAVPYDQTTQNRQIDHLFNYYQPKLLFKPAPSLLTGWDFPLNPFQFAASGSLTATAAYIVDQTIAARVTGAVTWQRSAISGGLEFTSSGGNNAFYIMQYLSGQQAKKILGTRLSVNVFGYKDSTSGDVTMRVYLFRGSSSASFPTLPTSIGTLASTGVFTLTASNWTEIPRSGLGTATAILSEIATNPDINNADNDYGFSGWEITNSSEIGDTDKFAIVVTFHYTDASTVITVNSISLVPGDLPCRPAPQSIDEVLRECRFYYEKSYSQGTYPGATNTNNAYYATLPTHYTTGAAVPGVIELLYAEEKRTTSPTITFYNPNSGASDSVQVHAFCRSTGAGNTDAQAAVSFSGNWVLRARGRTRASYDPDAALSSLASPAVAGTLNAAAAGVNYHVTIDARLGVV